MFIDVVELGIAGLGVYLLVGLLFSVPFLLRGAAAIDPDAAEGSLGFKALVFPGVVALWPLLIGPWRRGERRVERSPHRDASGGVR